jgi:phage shock protein C
MIDLFIGLSSFMALIITMVLLSIAVWIWALIDCITSNKDTAEKLIWIIIIILFSVIGAIIYLIVNSSGKKEIFKTNYSSNRLTRSRTDKIIAGVCGGIANYFKIDPVFVRLAFVLLVLLKGSGILIYIIAWIIMPLESEVKEKISKDKKTDKKKKNVGLTIFFIFLALIIFSFIGAIMFLKSSSEITKSLTVEEKDFRVKINDKGIFVDEQRDIVFTNDETKYSSIKNNVELRILNDYNYVAYNGSNLNYLGLKNSNECENKINCYEVIYEYDIKTDKLENKSFRVEALISNYDIVHISFTEI